MENGYRIDSHYFDFVCCCCLPSSGVNRHSECIVRKREVMEAIENKLDVGLDRSVGHVMDKNCDFYTVQCRDNILMDTIMTVFRRREKYSHSVP